MASRALEQRLVRPKAEDTSRKWFFGSSTAFGSGCCWCEPTTPSTVCAVAASRQVTDGVDKAPERKTRQLLKLSSGLPLHWGCSMSAEAVVQEQLSGAARTPLRPGVDSRYGGKTLRPVESSAVSDHDQKAADEFTKIPRSPTCHCNLSLLQIARLGPRLHCITGLVVLKACEVHVLFGSSERGSASNTQSQLLTFASSFCRLLHAEQLIPVPTALQTVEDSWSTCDH